MITASGRYLCVGETERPKRVTDKAAWVIPEYEIARCDEYIKPVLWEIPMFSFSADLFMYNETCLSNQDFQEI